MKLSGNERALLINKIANEVYIEGIIDGFWSSVSDVVSSELGNFEDEVDSGNWDDIFDAVYDLTVDTIKEEIGL